MRIARTAVGLLAVTAIAIGAGGCGDDEDEEGGGEAAAASSVTIRTFMYEPDPLEVGPGTTVTFTNEDDILHTVTEGSKGDLVDGGFDEQLDGVGTTAEVTFSEPGTIDYTCTIHEGMDGAVIVG